MGDVTRASTPRASDNLPVPPTPLIGREREVTTVRSLLEQDTVALVTLTGPGGVGKTRLALAIARSLIPAFDSGIVFVDLAPVADPGLVAATIAATLGLQETRGRSLGALLADYLRDKAILLVLDNFEQILPAAPLVASLIERCPGLKILVTSRAPLRLRGERQYPVPPLDLPVRGQALAELRTVSSVSLFVDRASAVQPGFVLTAETAPAVAAICTGVDGLPLAIELAAARTKHFTPQALVTRLDQRLRLLAGGPVDLPVRQQTLRGEIEWSYELLSQPEQTLFQRLSVFAGGWTIEAAEAVTNTPGDLECDSVDGIASLVDQSLVRHLDETGPDRGTARFGMLVTIRDYAAEQLESSGDAPTIRRAHAEYWQRYARQNEAAIRGRDQRLWLVRFDHENENFRAALDWCLGTHPDPAPLETGLWLATSLAWFWWYSGYWTEAIGWFDRLFAQVDRWIEVTCDPDLLLAARAAATTSYGLIASNHIGASPGRLIHQEALGLARRAGDKWSASWSLSMLSLAASVVSERDIGDDQGRESVALAKQVGDPWLIATAMLQHAIGEEDRARQRAMIEESLGLIHAVGTPATIAFHHCQLGALALAEGDPERAIWNFEESLRWTGESRMIWHTEALVGLGDVALTLSDGQSARTRFQAVLRMSREAGYAAYPIHSLLGLGRAALLTGDAETAATMLGAVEILLRQGGSQFWMWRRAPFAEALDQAQARLGPAAFEGARQLGRSLTLEQAIDFALTEDEAPLATIPTGSLTGDLAHLSPRETEVLRLIAAGRSNREIATNLTVTVNTVLRHVSNIFDKIGTTNRTEAAAYAIRHGLAP